MTIHKSQGSQFETAAVLLPPPGSRILTRELLYTAVTRARRGTHPDRSGGTQFALRSNDRSHVPRAFASVFGRWVGNCPTRPRFDRRRLAKTDEDLRRPLSANRTAVSD